MKTQTIKWDGKTITKPGVYSDVPIEEYHSQSICDGPSVSSSGLRMALEANGGSPAHFYAKWSGNPNRRSAPKEEEAKHFVIGRAVHHLMLGQASFSKNFVIRPDHVAHPDTGELFAWSGKGSNVAAREAFVAEAKRTSRAILTNEDIDDIRGMAIEIGRHPIVRGVQMPNGEYHGMLNGHIERSFFWKDKATGLWLKARPDAIPTDSGDFADLKTTTSTQTKDLMFAITDYAYHQQAALIREGALVCAKIEMASFTLVFVEKKEPWCVRPVLLKPDDIALGARQNRAALFLIAGCLKSGRWPGPGNDEIHSLDLVEFYKTRAATDVDELRREQDQARR